ncbi:MAG: hypothetical protein JWN93_3746 [Hyphomicrobiales bacterium]|nr:hypothetical protein [Hyphomicrobiales bacterium]
MTDAIAHRGPDGSGALIETSSSGHQIALGHRRLAIIDPAGGAQPMTSPDHRLSVVFNGEIYNFREIRAELAGLHGCTFHTDCDTEVLLESYRVWGQGCVHRLRGMFAFALWDRREETLFIARDRFGKKPLFLMQLGEGFAFASEIKALLAVMGKGPSLNVAAFPEYLLYRYVPGPATFFEGIVKLPPGHFAVWTREGLRTERYYALPKAAPERGLSTAAAMADYRRALEESVRIRLVSDAPFGAFLSGGIDSSTIVALMARHLAEPVKTFSIGFEGASDTELPAARRVAQHFRTEHHELVVSSDEIYKNLEAAISACDAPVSEPASIALMLLSREAARSVKMVLSGEGADEVMGGYAKHSMERFAGAYRRLPPGLRGGLARLLAAAPLAPARKLGAGLQTLGVEPAALRHALWFGGIHAHEITSFLGAPPKPSAAHLDDLADGSDVDKLLHFDQASWLPDNLLERGDRMTMAASIEARMPFMDQELIQLASTIPASMKIRGLTGKWLLRRSVQDVLPPSVLNRRKRGFPIPVSAWFRGPLKAQMREVLLDGDAVASRLIGRSSVETIIEEHMGGADRGKALWQLFNFNLFCSLYGLRP